MGKVLTEDRIEKAVIDRMTINGYYDFIDGYGEYDIASNVESIKDLGPKGTGRNSLKEVILPDLFLSSLKNLNPNIPENIIKDLVEDLRINFLTKDIKDLNYDNYRLIKNGIAVEYEKDGKKRYDTLKLIDFKNSENNNFTLMSQMWIKGEFNYRRPDLIIFVNGLPLVFIELKNSDVKVKQAYDRNLKDYLRDIPQLFYFNQFCVLSNGMETRLGSFTAGYGHFFEWLRNNEEDKVDRKELKEKQNSLEYLINGLFRHDELLDYIENFILYENKREKIIAKNHQYLGVNKAIEAFKNKDKLDGKLGVFWHTQGSGKSYSMAMYVNKINRKIDGNYTFLMITDRKDLDDQLYKNFLRTEVISEEFSSQPKDSNELRNVLKTNTDFIFTLIHKFRYDKTKKYPILSTRDDIVVIVDEAHRSQYKDLAENMRRGLPNAQYIAFTGTPLLGSERLTNQWFGDYVSEYNFSQAIDDGSTVPLYYSRRVPSVELINTDLDDDYLEIIENENLSLEEEERLSKKYAKTQEVLKRDSRLDEVAKDIAKHFPSRGYLGKGMVVSIDKFTAVKMHDKVQKYWDDEIKSLYEERSRTSSSGEKDRINEKIKYMNTVEMAVVISGEDGEVEKFKKEGLDISKHRQRMNYIDDNGHDIEDNFKDPSNPLSLVFVCAMWLTGFDAPATSTLYLDKPMKGHTLMQAIARVNRVFPGKNSGLVVDYLNLFKSMEKALGDYANPETREEMPLKDIEKLLKLLDKTVDEVGLFLKGIGIDLDKVLEENDDLKKVTIFRDFLDTIVDKDEIKEEFKVYSNLCRNIYKASKPEVFEMGFENKYLSPIFYLDDMLKNLVSDFNIDRAKVSLDRTLDYSVKTDSLIKEESNGYGLTVMKTLKLSEVDTSSIKKAIKDSEHKNIEIQELRSFIERKLEELLNENKTRISFSEKYKSIIDEYNSGNSTNENYFDDLVDFVDDLRSEKERHIREGLTEDELEIFDLLKKEDLTKEEEKTVKLSAKKLYEKIKSDDSATNVVAWYRDPMPKRKVKNEIEKVLDEYLPDTYGKDVFNRKTDIILTHILEESMINNRYYKI